MGHVFVDFDWDAVCLGFCHYAGIAPNDFKPILEYLSALGYEKGNVTTEEFVSQLSAKLNKPLTVPEFTRLWNSTFRENPAMAALLQELRLVRPLYLLSNTNENHYGYLQSTFNVARHFDELILSYEVRSQKPEQRIYQEVFLRSGLPPEEVAFFDDRQENIQAAKDAGIRHAYQFTGINELKQDLQLVGISI
jgi:HAD superfamily hydrolase (TIGR01509 family)